MAVPKKRTSKMKTKLRKAQWKAQATKEAAKALFKAKTVIKALVIESSSNLELTTKPETQSSSESSLKLNQEGSN